MNPWTPKEDARLRELARQGLSAAEMGKRMTIEFGKPRTKNSILGRCNRIGIALAKNQPKTLRVSKGKPFLDLKPKQCLFPYDNGLRCGKPVVKRDCCEAHYRYMYQPEKKKDA